MKITQTVRRILQNYESDTPGTKANLASLLMHGTLSGTGRMVIYPVDQGFEHGPVRSFSHNTQSLDPHYHFQLAIDAGLSAYAAPLGWLEAGADTFAGAMPLILKMNSNNTLINPKIPPSQALTASVEDALRLGCRAIGFTIYPGSDASHQMFEDIKELAYEAKAYGLAVVIWSYPRGNLSKEGETALDMVAYGAHMAALLGAHIIKVKLPSSHLEHATSKDLLAAHAIPIATLEDRVRYIVRSCFEGRRLVIFSGGEAREESEILEDAKAIQAGGGNGFIMGRNCFKRPRKEALDLLDQVTTIFKKS